MGVGEMDGLGCGKQWGDGGVSVWKRVSYGFIILTADGAKAGRRGGGVLTGGVVAWCGVLCLRDPRVKPEDDRVWGFWAFGDGVFGGVRLPRRFAPRNDTRRAEIGLCFSMVL